MKKAILFIILILTVSFTKTNAVKESDDFVYKVKLYPSFAAKGEIEITKTGKTGKIKLITQIDEYSPKALDKIAILNESDIEYFTVLLDNVSLAKLKNSTESGMDGMTFVNTFSQNGKSNEFKFWSPAKETEYYKVADAVIGLLKRKFNEKSETDYFAHLEYHYKRK